MQRCDPWGAGGCAIDYNKPDLDRVMWVPGGIRDSQKIKGASVGAAMQ